MRSRSLAALLPVLLLLLPLALGAAGCGSDTEEPRDPAPRPAATQPLPDPGPAVDGQLAAGELGVVDFTGRAAARPRTFAPNKDQVLRGTRWSGWGEREATGRGTLESLECEPSCAQGQTKDARATLVLSEPRTCGARRYYGRAELRSGAGEPAVFLRTPC